MAAIPRRLIDARCVGVGAFSSRARSSPMTGPTSVHRSVRARGEKAPTRTPRAEPSNGSASLRSLALPPRASSSPTSALVEDGKRATRRLRDVLAPSGVQRGRRGWRFGAWRGWWGFFAARTYRAVDRGRSGHRRGSSERRRSPTTHAPRSESVVRRRRAADRGTRPQSRRRRRESARAPAPSRTAVPRCTRRSRARSTPRASRTARSARPR